jgi:hypothetical protein
MRKKMKGSRKFELLKTILFIGFSIYFPSIAQESNNSKLDKSCAIEVSFIDLPKAVCDGDTIHFKAEAKGDIVSWEWDFGDGKKSSGKGSISKTFSYTLSYDEGFSTSPASPEYRAEYFPVITVNDRNGCMATDTVSVTVHKNNLRQKILPAAIRCGEENIKLHTEENLMDISGSGFSTAPLSWQWSTGDTTPEIHVSETSTYSVEMADQYGCKYKGRIYIKFPSIAENKIKVPNEVGYKEYFVLEAAKQEAKVKYNWQYNSNPSKNAWKDFSDKEIYSGLAGEISAGIHWKSGRHYIRLILENNERGGTYCSDTSEAKVMRILPEKSINDK